MDKAVITAVSSFLPLPVDSTPTGNTRETTKEFVRRPAKGWTDSTPVPVVRFDHHCEMWQQR